MARLDLSPWGYLALLVWGAIMAMALPAVALPWLLTALVLLAAYLAPRSLLALLQPGIWWLSIAVMVTAALWLGAPDVRWGRLTWSSAGALLGLAAVGRLWALLLSTSLARASLPLSSWIGLFGTVGLHGLGFALGVALNLLPTMRRLAETTWQSIRLRGGWRRPALACRLFLLTMLSNAISYGGQIVAAAAARAFDPATAVGQRIRVTGNDRLLLIAMGILTLWWVF